MIWLRSVRVDVIECKRHWALDSIIIATVVGKFNRLLIYGSRHVTMLLDCASLIIVLKIDVYSILCYKTSTYYSTLEMMIRGNIRTLNTTYADQNHSIVETPFPPL